MMRIPWLEFSSHQVFGPRVLMIPSSAFLDFWGIRTQVTFNSNNSTNRCNSFTNLLLDVVGRDLAGARPRPTTLQPLLSNGKTRGS
jgi:hypothetical protein